MTIDDPGVGPVASTSIMEQMLEWRGINVACGEAPCNTCGGSGIRVYGSTSTWRGGIGGQAMTHDVCDKCWGSGRDKYPWPSHRRLAAPSAPVQADYEEALASHRRLVRELDVLINGSGAAKQASLCDIVSQVKREGLVVPVQAVPDGSEATDALKTLDARLRECFGLPITAEEAYDSFYQEMVADALNPQPPKEIGE